jgi:hypothetical protein
MLLMLMAVQFIVLTGPDKQIIHVNPKAIIDLRPPRGNDHFAPGTHCLVFLSDGKPLTVQETCDQVKHLLEGGP